MHIYFYKHMVHAWQNMDLLINLLEDICIFFWAMLDSRVISSKQSHGRRIISKSFNYHSIKLRGEIELETFFLQIASLQIYIQIFKEEFISLLLYTRMKR